MPNAILFQSGFTGVDLKSNPLIIGERRKLRFATNIIFDEGVVRTRYGYRYEPLADAGQFQGACEFTPSQGISAYSFSDIQSGIALMVAGNLWFNGTLVGEGIYETTNNVNLYGAENYLIIQNLSGDTFWWDGDAFTRSPGMNEADFNDPETPTIELEDDIPVLTLEPCVDDPCALTGDGIIFHVVDSSTEASIIGAAVSITFKDSVAYTGTTGADGRVSFDMVSRTYRHQASAAGYNSSAVITFSVIEGEGQLITIRLAPIDTSPLLPFNIHGFLTIPSAGEDPGLYPLSAFFGPQIVPPGNAYRTAWMLRTDTCGADLSYFIGELNDDGELLTTGFIGTGSPFFAGFNTETQDFYSNYEYPDGMYLQLGVLIDDVWTWPDASPCIEGGDGTP